MNWKLDSYGLFFGYRCHTSAVDTVAKVFRALPTRGSHFVPKEAYVVEEKPFRVRTTAVNLSDPEAVIRLGHTVDDHSLWGYTVTLVNEKATEISWSMETPPDHLLDAFKLWTHRNHVQSEEDARALLSLACDLQPILSPVVGYIADNRTDSASPVPFEYRQNSHSLPERVRWANFWGTGMIELLGGMEKILAAPASEVKAFDDNGVMLLSSPTLMTYGESQDSARRQAIWEWFDLGHLHTQQSRIRERELLEKRKASQAATDARA